MVGKGSFMNSYEINIIAFLDILGFKNLINTKEFDKIKEIFQSIISDKEAGIALFRATGGDESLERYNEVLKATKIHLMSDSIIVAAPYKCKESLAVVIDICCCIQETLYEFEFPIFLRGAIARGELFLDNNVIFGKGLVDAYIAQENFAVYPRIIISAEIIENMMVSVEDDYKGLPVDKDGYYYIDTLERYINCDTKEELLNCERYLKMSNYIQSQLKGYADSRIREKYIWLQKELGRIVRNVALKEGELILDI